MPYDPRQMQAIGRMGIGMMAPEPSPFQQPQQQPRRRRNGGSSRSHGAAQGSAGRPERGPQPGAQAPPRSRRACST